MSVIFGINAVAEALKARGRSFDYIAVSPERHDLRVHKIVTSCRELGVPVRQLPREQLNRLAPGSAHQGVIAVAHRPSNMQTWTKSSPTSVANGRSFCCSMAWKIRTISARSYVRPMARARTGSIIPERRAVGVTGTVTKASAGASEHLPIARVTNVGRTLEELKEKNIWTVGLDEERGSQAYDKVDYRMSCALVLGAEGKGLHEQVRKKCDFLVSIPMLGQVPSLNVSVAAAVVMYEVARQRRTQPSKKANTRPDKRKD